MLDDEETGLVEQLLRRPSTSEAGVSGSTDVADDEDDGEVMIGWGMTSHGSEAGGKRGGVVGGVGVGGGLPRRRMGSQVLGIGGEEGEEEERAGDGGDEEGALLHGGMEDEIDREMFAEKGRVGGRPAGRGLGALIAGAFYPAEREGGEERGERRPLLGRSRSSTRIRVRGFCNVREYVCVL